MLKGKRMFVKNDMARCNDFLFGCIETHVPTVVGWVTKEDTRMGAGLKFMNGCRAWERVAKAIENP